MYFNLGEVGGILRVYLYDQGITTIQVPPTTLKKYITGSGKANKDVIIKELYKNYNIDVNDNNQADAAGLAILAREFFETPYHCVPALRTDIHKACDIIVGDHPNRMTAAEYFADVTDEKMLVHEYDKMKKAKKKIE